MSLDKYYEVYRDLFLHPGWKQFVEDSKESYDSINLDACKDFEAFLVARTMRRELSKIINFEEFIKASEDRYEQDKLVINRWPDDNL